ncbi:hypothetical protein ABIB56_001139 [Glaciihabitans sp. UYNi722]
MPIVCGDFADADRAQAEKAKARSAKRFAAA